MLDLLRCVTRDGWLVKMGEFLVLTVVLHNFSVLKDITHNLRNNLPIRIPKTRISSYRIESFSFLGCKLWNSLPII